MALLDSPENNEAFSYASSLDFAENPFEPELQDFIQHELALPVKVRRDTSLRPKIIDSCGLTCTFCHNEGTPVAADNRKAVPVNFISRDGRSGRVSVFVEQNGVTFIPGLMRPDNRLESALTSVRDATGIDELHLTGGEPSLHPNLPELISMAVSLGLTVKMTSNGEKGGSIIPAAAAAGLKKINFSIFGTNAHELAQVQHEKYQDIRLAEKRIEALHESIDAAVASGIEVDANIVMSDISHASRLERLLFDYSEKLGIRVMADLGLGSESKFGIYKFLSDIGARAIGTVIDAGSSNLRVDYKLANGRNLGYKQILPTRLPKTCQGCQFDTDCKEGFYGVRLYVDDAGEYKVGVCLQRMDLTLSLEDFMVSGIAQEIVDYREAEYKRIQNIVKSSGRAANGDIITL
jgi:GTP 3',8-cyclase